MFKPKLFFAKLKQLVAVLIYEKKALVLIATSLD